MKSRSERFQFLPVLLGLLVFVGGLGSCSDISSYTTAPGECYVGEVVDADFLLKCFSASTKLKISLDVNDLAVGNPAAGRITTSDGLFEDVPFSQPPEFARDTLSLFRFPSGHETNFMAYTYSEDPTVYPTTVVISLMDDSKLEVRLIKHVSEEGDGSTIACSEFNSNLFGLFRLKLDRDCEFTP